MAAGRLVARVFWPEGLDAHDGHAWVVGWAEGGLDACVVATVPSETAPLDAVRAILAQWISAHRLLGDSIPR